MDVPTTSRESERRHATVVFADISGFTRMSEQLDPEEFKAKTGIVKVKLGNLAPRHPNTFKAAVSTKAWFSAAAANEDAARTNLQLQVGARCFEHVVTKKTD